jgi:surface antigen
VFSSTFYNPYGHVAIVSNYKKNNVEIIQQNCFTSRESYQLSKIANKYTINESGILGWLRIKE